MSYVVFTPRSALRISLLCNISCMRAQVRDPSLLRFLVDMRDADLDDKQLRDDLMTMLIAGHETTAAVRFLGRGLSLRVQGARCAIEQCT